MPRWSLSSGLAEGETRWRGMTTENMPPLSRDANAPELFMAFSLQRTEGAGKAGCFAHPQPRVRMKKDTSLSHHRSARNNPAFPARWCYGLFRARPGDRAFLPPSSARCQAPCRLDISVGISGPHDFAVRIVYARLARQRVHRIPRPRFVTMRNVPPIGHGTRKEVPVICPTSQVKLPATFWHDGQITWRTKKTCQGFCGASKREAIAWGASCTRQRSSSRAPAKRSSFFKILDRFVALAPRDDRERHHSCQASLPATRACAVHSPLSNTPPHMAASRSGSVSQALVSVGELAPLAAETPHQQCLFRPWRA